ncbi:tetratricopeptide repeat protein [Longibaculum muris]|uniref:tetratricopeptide repeat protein n=1 Tax=Longibaculum muris TaxID=1796628 RepID=UPI00189D3CD7|nr:SEL1-like repeat protein [Longibaculum muris]
MDIRIIQSVLDVFEHYGDTIRFDFDRFEEAMNDEAPDLLDECYLVVLGMKLGVFDAMVFDEDVDLRGYVDYLVNACELNEKEALFLVSVFEVLVDEVGYYFEIPNMDELLQDAYQRNDFEHLFVIGKTYFLGFGVTQDYEKAFEIYSYLYGHGDDRGAYYLGYMYEHGYGIEMDIEKALMYYENTSDDLTCLRLGLFYMLGKYVHKDLDKALSYFESSHEKEAYLYQGLLLEAKREHAQAFEAYLRGARLFQKDCLYKVGICLKLGLGVDVNMQEAHRYFEYAYDLLHEDGAYELAMMYFDGLTVKKDEKKAIHYLIQAAALNSLDANLALARFYELGRYVERNHRQSLYYYQKAQQINEYHRNKEISHEDI